MSDPEHTENPPPETEQAPKKRQAWKSLLIYGGILLAVYFGHVQIQTFLGQRALDNVALELISFDEALIRSAESGKPVLLDVSAIWCPSCRKLDSKVLSRPDVQALIEEHYVFTRVEFESDQGVALQERYGIKGFPTLLVLNSNGDRLRALNLTFDPEAFKTLLTRTH
ncbi:Thiol:disulfide interchange protein [Alteromonadaceae bacterium Bs31]|nr:Thiol:disulfide interchange protein [Alteromonadaceae bacterium Bs31]